MRYVETGVFKYDSLRKWTGANLCDNGSCGSWFRAIYDKGIFSLLKQWNRDSARGTEIQYIDKRNIMTTIYV